MDWKRTASVDPAAELALIERCQRQDAEAFGRIVDLYQNRIYGFIRKMVPDSDEASDLTQDTFIRAFQAIGRFDGRSSLRTWLFRIAHNLCVDRSRRNNRTPVDQRLDGVFEEDESIDVPDSRWDPEGLVLNQELFAIVEQGVNSMSEKLRSVLLLHDKEDMSYDEIANVLNLPVGTVKSRLFLARNHLQNVLEMYTKGESYA